MKGLIELGIELRISNARRTVLARVSGLVVLLLILCSFLFTPAQFDDPYKAMFAQWAVVQPNNLQSLARLAYCFIFHEYKLLLLFQITMAKKNFAENKNDVKPYLTLSNFHKN